MSEAQKYKYIGRRTVRPDGFDKVTGRANYGADISLPGMIWGKTLRSPHAHAKILSIDTSRAEAHPDVFSVATFKDFVALRSENIASGEGAADVLDVARNCLADDKVLYHGHAIAAIAARTERSAKEALALIDVTYEILPSVMDMEDAMKEEAPVLHEDMFTAGYEEKPTKASNIASRVEMKMGDIEAGFEEADIIVEREFKKPIIIPLIKSVSNIIYINSNKY